MNQLRISSMKRIAALLLLAVTIWYGLFMSSPPSPKPADAPATEFSAHRAFEHVQNMGRAPHPLGTEEHARVREYITGELRDLGLQPEIHSGIALGGFYGGAAHVQNIFARIDGTAPSKTILLMAHYDSVPNAPGASDDGSGVSAILETVRALLAEGTPQNNVWVLITDGEERGLLGAEYFVDHHPAADSVDLVMNVEARGSSGPSFMFETSSPNRSLIPHFARSATHPVANSLTYTVYKMLPNDTDLSVTKEAGLAGLNFAYTGSHLDYHTMEDNPENMSLASLQHHGQNLLPVTRYFAGRDFNLSQEGEMVYFNNLSGGLTHYPASWSLPLALVTLLLFLVWMVYLFRTGRLGWGRWLGSLLIFLLIIAAGALITRFGFQLMADLHPQYRWLAHGEVYPHVWYLAAFGALMLALILPLFHWLQKRWEIDAPLSGAYTVWLVIGTLAAWQLPTASYLFTWPALLGLVGWVVLGDAITERNWKTLGILFLSLLAGLYMVPFYIEQVQVMMTTRMLFVCMALLLLLAGLCWPWIHYITGKKASRWTGGLALLALGCLVGASLNSGFDADHRKQNSLIYLADLDAGEARWISGDHATDEWTRQFLGDSPSQGPIEGADLLRGGDPLHSPATFTQDAGALELEVLSDSLAGSDRHLRLRLDSPSGGILLHMTRSGENGFRRLHVGDTNLLAGHEEEDSSPRLLYFGDLSSGELQVSFACAAADTLDLTVEVVKPGFPSLLMEEYRPRPDYMMPVPNSMSDVTVLRKRFRLLPAGE